MRVSRFLSVSGLGLVINVGIASWVALFAGPAGLLARWWPSVAALAGTMCGLAFNFAGYKYLVFCPAAEGPRIPPCSDTLNERRRAPKEFERAGPQPANGDERREVRKWSRR